MKKSVFLIIFCLFVTANLFAADVIILKSGQKVEGDILERNRDMVQIDAYGVKMTYFIDEVLSINGEKISASVSGPAVLTQKTNNIVTEPVSQEIKEERIVTQTPSQIEVTEQTTSKYTSPYPLTKGSDTLKTYPGVSRNKAYAVMGIVFLVFFVIFVIFYIYFAICLQFIAKKTNTENSWLAWIPIGNLFLMCKIASLSYLWVLGFFLGFIPYIGIILSLCYSAYLWYRIGLARNKEPQWIGVLVAVPVVGIFVMGYLAFSE